MGGYLKFEEIGIKNIEYTFVQKELKSLHNVEYVFFMYYTKNFFCTKIHIF